MDDLPAHPSCAAAAMEEALDGLGVRPDTLAAREVQALERDGFLILRRFLDDAWLVRLRAAYEAVAAREGALVGLDHHQEPGARRLGNLVNKGEAWDSLYIDPRLLAATRQVLARPFKLGALSGRDPLRGGGIQGFHCDCAPRMSEQEPYRAVSACILLDASTLANGATRLIPGSHRRLGDPRTLLAADADPRTTGEIQLTLDPGDALVFNAHLWHAGAANRDGSVRRMVHAYYQGREQASWLDQAEFIRKRTWERISPGARWLLDV